MSDGNQGQDAIIAKLDELILAVNRLSNLMTAQPSAAPTVEAAPAASKAIAELEVPQSASVSAPLPGAHEMADVVDVIVDEHVVGDVPGPGADLQAVLARMFQAALHEDKELAWRELTALTHPKELVAPRALDSFKAFSWKQLRKNARSYLRAEDTSTFTVVRTDPAELSGDDSRVKVFLAATGRSPAPITLLRDVEAGGAWRLGQVSL